MKLILDAYGMIVDIAGTHNCPICNQPFYKEYLVRGYCKLCRNHYGNWRRRNLREEARTDGHYIADTSVQRFRELYLSGQLDDMKPWTWPGETVLPIGAVLLKHPTQRT